MKNVLPVIVISQFFCTSLWFAGNAVVGDLIQALHIDASYLAHLASVIQAGFITGTLVFALLGVADRFSPSKVFFVCALIAAASNLMIAVPGIGPVQLLLLRFVTGFFLAGIYPVGMKIAADYFQQGLGRSLGYLVGALVLGTAFPHFLKSVTGDLPWKYVIFSTTALAAVGGIAMLVLVPDGPFRKPSPAVKLAGFLDSFKDKGLRAAAFGYFGHMWELYAFWVFVPLMLSTWHVYHPQTSVNIPILAFAIIASGSVACVGAGFLAERFGARNVAAGALVVSGACCLLSPLMLIYAPFPLFVVLMFVWAITVIADSPLFSTLVAQNAPSENRGTALTIVNCLGFATTIFAVQLLNVVRTPDNAAIVYLLLAPGPVVALLLFLRK